MLKCQRMAEGTVLVADDEAKIVDVVRAYLEREGYRALTARDGREALDVFRRERPDLIILDLMMPEMDGLEVCRAVRKESATPIIMLTARSEDADKLVGLELGADDYVTKPFSPRELVARVRAVLRRTSGAMTPSERITRGGITLDAASHEVAVQGRPVSLTATEFKLLLTLMQRPGQVFTRAQLLDVARGELAEAFERTVDAHVKNLRRKLGMPAEGGPAGIVTVHGVGYKFQESGRA